MYYLLVFEGYLNVQIDIYSQKLVLLEDWKETTELFYALAWYFTNMLHNIIQNTKLHNNKIKSSIHLMIWHDQSDKQDKLNPSA